MRPLWRSAAGALQSVLERPSDTAELWYDDRDIAFLREDMKDEAEIDQIKSLTIARLVNTGYTSESVLLAVASGDYSKLEHSGMFSVQLQAAGAEHDPERQTAGASHD